MARTTEFSHDTLGHLLIEKSMQVPTFQRSFSWTEENIEEFWGDITKAMDKDEPYFLGTVVLADKEDGAPWKYIVDGQQRITTTALVMVAITSKLRELGKKRAADTVFDDHIASYDLGTESELPKLELSGNDQVVYSKLVELAEGNCDGASDLLADDKGLLSSAYRQIGKLLDDYSALGDQYRQVVELQDFLDDKAQVLLAIASGLSEAYVIFETLNDRGADLTTVDLLKNYFLSSVGDRKVNAALEYWNRISGHFDQSKKLIDYIKAHYNSKWGLVKNKELYRALQKQLDRQPQKVLEYLRELESSVKVYAALNDPDAEFWSGIATDVRDDIIAHRRFNITAPFGMYMAAMNNWRPKDYCELIKAGTNWAIRASLVGSLGGGSAEKLYGELASKISNKELKNVASVRKRVLESSVVPNDAQFCTGLMSVNDNNLSRAKYFLAMLEKQYRVDHGNDVESMPAWDSKTISVEHIVAKSKKIKVGAEGENANLKELQHFLPNLTLLERAKNGSLDDKPYSEKKETYSNSAFLMTSDLSKVDEFDDDAIAERRGLILDLACKVWPR